MPARVSAKPSPGPSGAEAAPRTRVETRQISAPAPAVRKPGALSKLAPAIPLGIALLYKGLAPVPPSPPGKASPPAPPSRTQSAPAPQASDAANAFARGIPYPLLSKTHPVDWWFSYKMNSVAFPKCAGGDTRKCYFGGEVAPYRLLGMQYIVASSDAPALQNGSADCIGNGTGDPVGATFDEIYNGGLSFVLWNDQPYEKLELPGCDTTNCGSWGHSKGIVAWNGDGQGLVMQVSTPSWPGTGSPTAPRDSGNTLGCITKPDNVIAGQHFFAVRLDHDDLIEVLAAMRRASVATIVDGAHPKLSRLGGPADIQAAARLLGTKDSDSTTASSVLLSSKIRLIAKPNKLQVPPWQMISSLLGGIDLMAATWWTRPTISSTTRGAVPECWSTSLTTPPGEVDIVKSGTWQDMNFSLEALPSPNSGDGNHGKFGVSTSGKHPYAIFGDMNQQGYLTNAGVGCSGSQNGRGGMFFVLESPELATSLTEMMKETEPLNQVANR